MHRYGKAKPAEATGKSFDDTTGTAEGKRTNSRLDMTGGSTCGVCRHVGDGQPFIAAP